MVPQFIQDHLWSGLIFAKNIDAPTAIANLSPLPSQATLFTSSEPGTRIFFK
jgi:hypothetical protein